MEKLPLDLSKLLYLRFTSLYGEKFTRNYPSDQLVELWWEDWSEGLAGIKPESIKDAIQHCRTNLEWPPSLAEFRRICEQSSGVPSVSEAMDMAIRRDFSHPIVSIAYDKVGSWAMKNDKQEVLRTKFQEAYTNALNEFRQHPAETWQKLEEFNSRKALPEPLPKILTKDECKTFRQRLAEYEVKAKADKAKLTPQDHPTWEKDKIMRGHKNFDENVFNDRREYLIGMDEYVANSLSHEDKYDRIRYLREIEAQEYVKKMNPGGCEQEINKTSSRAYNGPRKVYKHWND